MPRILIDAAGHVPSVLLGVVTGTVFLVLVATNDGNFHFFDRTGNELLVVPSGHNAPLTAVSTDFSDGTMVCAVHGLASFASRS